MYEHCNECLLYKAANNPFIHTSGSKEPDVLFIVEAPSHSDDKEGVLLSGDAGFYLRRCIKMIGLENYAITSLLKCAVGNDSIKAKHIASCKHIVMNEIERMKPKVIVLIGNIVLKTFLGYANISNFNGKQIVVEDQLYVPLYNPAFIVRNPHMEDEFLSALLTVQDAVDAELGTESVLDDYEQIIVRNLEQAKQMAEAIKAADYFICDLETNTLDFTALDHKILTLNFCAEDKVYMVPYKHEQAAWMPQELEVLKDIVIDVLKFMNGKLVNHNVKFDQLHLYREFGVFCEAEADTMLISYMLNTNRGLHGLKRLSTIHIGLGGYDDAIEDYKSLHPEANPNKGGSYAAIPLELLLPYGGLDVIAVDLLYPILLEQLSESQVDFFYEVLMPASDALAIVEWNGFAIDYHIVQRYKVIYGRFQETLRSKIHEDPSIKKAEKILQAISDYKKLIDLCSEQLVRFFGIYKPKTISFKDNVIFENDDYKLFYKDGAFHLHSVVNDKIIKRRRKREIVQFNLSSVNHLRALYFNVLKIPSEELTKTGQLSTSSKIMSKHSEDYGIVSDIRLYSLYNKMLGTYIIPAYDGTWKSYDDRVRSTYNLIGTKTGRLSSSNPNLQNIPTPEKEPNTLLADLPVKNMFTHSYWDRSVWPPKSKGYLVAFDYSGMELRVIASIANCTGMIEAFANNFDIHCYVTRMIFPNIISADTDDKTIKKEYTPYRYRAKWVNWTLLYGGTKYTLMNLYGVSEEEATTLVESYYEAFPEILDFREYTTDFTQANGYIESVFGRREQLPEIKSSDRKLRSKAIRSAVNMPIQSTASDILLCALIIIIDKLRSSGMRSKVVNTVHDSIVLDVPEEEIHEVVILVKDIMENVATYAETYMPSVDFSWLKCPLKADAEVGTHYGYERSYSSVFPLH